MESDTTIAVNPDILMECTCVVFEIKQFYKYSFEIKSAQIKKTKNLI